MKKCMLVVGLLVGLSLFPCLAFAEEDKKEKNTQVAITFEGGEKFTEVFGYEESDLSDDITYWRDQLSLNQKVNPRLSYTITQLLENRDFDNNNKYDNRFTQTAISSIYKLPESESFLMPQEIRSNYMYKHKDYIHNTTQVDNNDYVQNKFGFGVSYFGDKEKWRIDYDTGMNVFDYSSNTFNNESKFFNQIQYKNQLIKDKFSVLAAYKIQYADRKNSDNRTEPTELLGFDFKPMFKYLSRLSFRFEYGKAETRDEEIRDDILDYHYERFTTTIDTPLTLKLSNSLIHKLTEREYANWNKSYHQLKMLDTLRYTQIDDKIRVLLYDINLEYKESRYPQLFSSNSITKAAGLSLNYERKKNWKIKSGLAFRLQKFQHNNILDARRYVYTLGLEKILSSSLFVAFDYRFEFRDYYRGAPDRTYAAYKLSMNYKF